MKSENFLIVHFKSADGKFFELEYKLFDNPFVQKWFRFFVESQKKNKSTIFENGAFYGAGFYEEEEVRNEIVAAINVINSYKKDWIKLVPYKNMSQSFLSALHDDFERIDHLLHYEIWRWPQRQDFLKMCEFVAKACWNALLSRRLARIKAPVVPFHVIDAVTKLNVLIHRYEVLGDSCFGHVEVLNVPVERKDFEDEDYSYFSCDHNYGWLYLAYGVTGVPPMNAFLNRITTLPVPQSNYTTGIRLGFIQTSKFEQMPELIDWFKKQFGWNAEDPKTALGYIPLGELQTKLSKEELIQKIKAHRFVHSVEVYSGSEKRESLLPALWPSTNEIQYHLKYKPFIELPISFNHEACLREATALLEKFVVHRDYDQNSETTGKWKSLGINALDGDSSKTLNFPSYGVSEPQYALTEVARLCPETFAFLRRVTDLRQCQRVRFMLLEPGARISPHSDSLTKDMTDTTLAINIALNMPDGCEFWSCLNKDGSRNLYSQKLPMKDGSFFIFNNSQYHSVVNNSNTARIHIIIHGPIRFSPENVLAIAQKQNNLFTRKALMNQIVKKFSLLGCDIKPDSRLYLDWLAAGHDGSLTSPEIALAIVADNVADEKLMNEAVHNFTVASIFPERPPIIHMNDLDAWLENQLALGFAYAALIGGGTYFLSANSFVVELFRTIDKMRTADAVVAGHIMHRNGDELPFLHEQFLILDLKKWESLGRPSLEQPCVGTPSTFREHFRSAENIHDDYTPLWLNPVPFGEEASIKIEKKSGRSGWCTQLLAAAIEKRQTVINVPLGLRHTKKFSYPRAGRDWQYQEIKQAIQEFLLTEKNKVYVVNNEPLHVSTPEGFGPDQLISVSAGLKPAALVYQFWKDDDPAEINIIDFSQPALQYTQELIRSSTPDKTKFIMKKWFMRTHSEDTSWQLAEDYFHSIIRDSFDGDFQNLLNSFHKMRKARFSHGDIINNPEIISGLLKPHLKPYFWHSNAFSSNASLYTKTSEELSLSYRKLALLSAKALGVPAWAHRNSDSNEVFFGTDAVQGVFSAGYGRTTFQRQDFNKIDL